MLTSTLAKDLMATRLVTLKPEMDALEAIGLLLHHKISGAPVIDDEHRYLGVFSEKSCMQILVDAATEQLPSTQVQAFMNTDLGRTITPDTNLLSVAHMFFETNFRRLPVIEGGLLVGQVSRRDVLRKTHELLKVAPVKERSLLYLSALVDREDAPLN